MEPKRERGELERAVVAALAAAGRPLTPADVLAELSGSLAYTTVMTTLTRLVDKGALGREPSGRSFAYRLVTDEATIGAALTARRMSRLLDGGTDRTAALAHFVADLRPEDEQVLAELLAETAGQRTPKGRSKPS